MGILVVRDFRKQLFAGELTSSATQKVVLEKMGHRKCAEIAFAEFTLNGTRPFASITEPQTVILAEETL